MSTTPISTVSARVAPTQTCAIRRSTVTFACRRASIRCHKPGMNPALASGSGQASRYCAHNASSFSELLGIFCILHLLFVLLVVSLEHPLPGPKQPYLEGILINPVNLLKFLKRQPF